MSYADRFPPPLPTDDDEPIEASLLFSPSEIYHENSKIHPSNHQLARWIHFVNSSPSIRRLISQPVPGFRGHPSFPLPPPPTGSPDSLTAIVRRRRSVHRFSGRPLSLATLGHILYLGNGVTATVRAADGVEWQLRAAPSGGGLYPIEIYCLALRVEGLPAGLYRYDPGEHKLESIREGDFGAVLAEATYLPDEVGQAGVCLILSALFGRSKFKYGERAYRLILLEAGHIAQNVLLAATATGHGSLPIGGFTDDAINALLGVDGVREAALYLILIGGEP